VKLEYEKAVDDLTSIKDLVSGANNYASKLEADSNSWQKQLSSLVSVSKITGCFVSWLSFTLIYSLIYRNKRRVFLLPSLQIFAK
jgi:hypothetical protein